MKTLLIFLLLIYGSCSQVFAQAWIIKKTGEELKVKIIEIQSDTIKYKRIDAQDSSLKVCPTNEVFLVQFESGIKQIFDTPDSEKETQSIDNQLDNNEDKQKNTEVIDYQAQEFSKLRYTMSGTTVAKESEPNSLTINEYRLLGFNHAKTYYRNRSIFWVSYLNGFGSYATLILPSMIAEMKMVNHIPNINRLKIRDKRYRTSTSEEETKEVDQLFKNKHYASSYHQGIIYKQNNSGWGGYTAGITTVTLCIPFIVLYFIGR